MELDAMTCDTPTALRFLASACGRPVEETWMRKAADEIERLREANGWIPVTERLPKGGEPIVLGFGGGYALPAIAEWKNGGLVWCHRSNIVLPSGRPNTPTHWMPLPEPPTA